MYDGHQIRAHPAISHCSHLLLKCRVATNISLWLKVQSMWFKNYIFAKKCILISFWIFKHCKQGKPCQMIPIAHYDNFVLRPRHKTSFMLNSTEHEISTAQK